MSTKFAPRLRARAIWKSKSWKNGMPGALLEVDLDKICTTSARKSDLEVKILKKLAGPEHFSKLSFPKFAPRLRARAIWKSKSLKTGGVGALLEVQLDKICTTPARESDFYENKMKPTNPNADTYVEEQRQYLFITYSNEPTCGTPWLDALRWHSCRTPLLDTIAQRLVKHLYLTLLWDTLAWQFFWGTLTWHSCRTLLTWHSYLRLL